MSTFSSPTGFGNTGRRDVDDRVLVMISEGSPVYPEPDDVTLEDFLASGKTLSEYILGSLKNNQGN